MSDLEKQHEFDDVSLINTSTKKDDDHTVTSKSGYLESFFMVDGHEGKFFVCSDCGLLFKKKKYIRNHLRTIHGKSRPFLCSKCGLSFKMQPHLQAHIRSVHNAERPYPCTECDQAFKRSGDLRRHLKIHTGDKLFSCNECGVSFRREDAKRKHLLVVHSENRPFKCNICDRAFKRKTDLRDHSSVHSRERPYVCHDCGLTFSRKHNVKRHLLYVHFSNGEKPFKCDKCGQRFKQRRSLQRHSEIHDRPNDESNSLTNQNMNLPVGTDENQLNCGNCNKIFKLRPALSRHAAQCKKSVFSGDKFFKCEKCDRRFKQLRSLVIHSATHDPVESGLMPEQEINSSLKIYETPFFSCGNCKKTFNLRHALSRHAIRCKEYPQLSENGSEPEKDPLEVEIEQYPSSSSTDVGSRIESVHHVIINEFSDEDEPLSALVIQVIPD